MTARLVEYVEGRFLLDLWHSCSFHCSYCYVQYERMPEDDIVERIEMALDQLSSHDRFFAGPEGPLLSLSPHAESFNSAYRFDGMIKLLGRLSALGNPIQFATKTAFDGSMVRAVADAAGGAPVTAFTSVSTVTGWQRYEAGTPSPQERFLSIRRLREAGLHSCLYIKPIIPGVTIADIEHFRRAILDHRIELVCCGVLYADTIVAERLGADPAAINPDDDLRMPGVTGMTHVHLRNRGEVDLIVAALSALPGVEVFRSSPCVVARSSRSYSRTLTWRRFPELCVGCQDCEGIYLGTTSKTPDG